MYSAAAFLILCAACTVLAFVRHPIYGLYFYLAATYVFPPSRWWGYMFPEIRWSLIAAAVTVLAVLLHRSKLRPRPLWLDNAPAMVLVIYAAWMWIQSPWALDLPTHFVGTLQFTKSVVAFWFVYRIVDTKERVRDMLLAHLLGCTLLGIFGFVAGREEGRLDGVGGPGMDDANTLGLYFATAVIVGVGLVLTQTGWRRWLSLGCVAITANGLILTNTRGATLGLVAGGMVLALFKARAHRGLFWIFALVGLIGVTSIIDQGFIDRMVTIQDVTSDSEEADSSARSRIVVLQAQVQMFLDYPMGSGHRGTAALSPQYLDERWLTTDWRGTARSSHNTFMTALVEQGIPGAVLFLWLTLWTLIAILKLRRLELQHGDPNLTTLASATGGALAVIFVTGFSADFLLVEVQFWLFAAFVSVLQLAAIGSTSERAAASPALARHGVA